MRLLILALLLAACAPPAKDALPVAQAIRSLNGAWSNQSQTITFDVANNTISTAYKIGGSCQYAFSMFLSDPDQHDQSAGTLIVSGGTPVNVVPGMSCTLLNGPWTYAVLISNSLQICQSGNCLELK